MSSLPLVSPPPARRRFASLRLLRGVLLFILIVFVAPSAATMAWWALAERPTSWRNADWGPSGVLPPANADQDAAVYIMAARTGGMKGALSVHSWIVTKEAGATSYNRYDKVGWGSPIRTNGYPADAFWYSNRPEIVRAIRGAEATRLIPEIEAAIADYPYAQRGGYRIWPGPNSNSFVAHVLNEVPAIGTVLPPNATGRDYADGPVSLRIADDWRDLHFTLNGFAGFAVGARSGIEIHFMGAVAGIDILRPALKIPAYGRVGFH